MSIRKLPGADDEALAAVARLQRLRDVLDQAIPPKHEGSVCDFAQVDKPRPAPPTFAEIMAIVERRGKRRRG